MPATKTIVYGDPAEQAAVENIVQEQLPEEHMPGLVGDLAPSRQISSVSTATGEAEPPLALTQSAAQPAAHSAEQPEFQSAPPDQRAGTLAPAVALAGAEALDDRQTTPQQQPEDVVGHTEGQAVPQATATSTVEVQPTTPGTETQTAPPQAAPGQPGSQRPEEDSGLTPAGVAVLVSALASKLAGDQQHQPEASPQQAPEPPASPAELPAVSQVEAPESQTAPESAPAARVMPIAYAIPDNQPGTAADIQDEPHDAEDAATGVNPDESGAPAVRTEPKVTADEAQGTGAAADASTGSAPAVGEPVGPTAGSAIDSGKTPPAVTSQDPGPVLPLSAILPRAAKSAPLSKSGQAMRPEPAQTKAVAASGIEPDIEQVSNQLDGLIDSINGLIERTQPLLEPPVNQAPLAETTATSVSPAAQGGHGAGDDSDIDESVDTGVTGPYSAQNLSRMEYGLVQLMQAVRRLGRDVRSAF